MIEPPLAPRSCERLRPGWARHGSTLKSPRATVDRGDLLVEAAVAWATRGLSLVADQIVQRLAAFGSPCEMVLRRDASDPQP